MGRGGGTWNPFQLKNTGYFKRFSLFTPRGGYGWFYGITDRSNHTVTVYTITIFDQSVTPLNRPWPALGSKN